MPNFSEPGNVLLLTKPLGTNLISIAKRWITTDDIKLEKSLEFTTLKEIEEAYDYGLENMATLNYMGGLLMKKY